MIETLHLGPGVDVPDLLRALETIPGVVAKTSGGMGPGKLLLRGEGFAVRHAFTVAVFRGAVHARSQ